MTTTKNTKLIWIGIVALLVIAAAFVVGTIKDDPTEDTREIQRLLAR